MKKIYIAVFLVLFSFLLLPEFVGAVDCKYNGGSIANELE